MPVTDRLLDALDRIVKPPLAATDDPRVLILGARTAAGLLAGLRALLPAARFTVIEHDPEALAALGRAADAPEHAAVRGGAGDLLDLAPGPYALAIVRHPDVAAARGGWEVALEASIAALTAGGMLVATTHVLPDAAFVDSVARARGLAMVPGTPYTAVPVDMTDTDRYILIYTSA